MSTQSNVSVAASQRGPSPSWAAGGTATSYFQSGAAVVIAPLLPRLVRLKPVRLPLERGEGVRLARRGGIELTVEAVEIVVERGDGRVRRETRRGGCPDRVQPGRPRRDRCQQRVAVGGARGLGQALLRQLRHVADDLRPEAAAGAPTAGPEGADTGPGLAHDVEVVAHREGRALEQRASDVAARVRGGEAEQQAAGVGVEERRALTVEVRQGEEAAGPGAGAGGLLEQRLVRDIAGDALHPDGERAGDV